MFQTKTCRAIKPAIMSTLVQDPRLKDLSDRYAALIEPDLGLDLALAAALGIPDAAAPLFSSSFDASLAYIRQHFPQPEWRYGLQDAGYQGYTGPVIWLNNGRCQIEGFDNHYNYSYRYHERSARRIEFAAGSVIALAESFRRAG